jgi:hypothetical protein
MQRFFVALLLLAASRGTAADKPELFATLTAVAEAAEARHRDGERLMRLLRDCTERHSRGRKQTCCKTCENRGRSQSFSAPERYRYDKFNMCLLSAFASSVSHLVRGKAQKTGLTNQH